MNAPPPPLLGADRAARPLFWLVVALPLLLALAPKDLWAPEEPRFGRVAHEMATEGDWLVTRLNGLVDAEKPPLLFWAMAGVEKVSGGPTPVGARLPGALLGVLAIFATRSLAKRLFGDVATANTAAILFATTGVVVWNAPRVGMDVGLAAFSALALEGAAAAIVSGSWAGAARMGVALGLGLLLKGPHVLYVPIAGAVGGAIAARGGTGSGSRSPRGASVRVLAGVLLGAAVFALWLVPALVFRGDEAISGGMTYRERLLGQIARRVTGTDEPHLHGPLYLLPVMLASLLPYIVFTAAGARAAVRARSAPAEDRFGLGAAIASLVVPLVLLSIPASKRETYLVPLLPSAAALAAYAIHRAPFPAWNRAGVHVLAAVLGALAIGLVALPFVAPRMFPGDRYDVVTGADLSRTPIAVVFVAAGLAAGAACFMTARSVGSALFAARRTALAIAALALVAWFLVFPAFDPAKSLADAAVVARREAPDAPFYVAATSDPSALWNFGNDRVGFVSDYAGLSRLLAPDAPRALVLAKGRFWADVATLAKPEERPALERIRVLWERRVSGTTWHLLTNAPPR